MTYETTQKIAQIIQENREDINNCILNPQLVAYIVDLMAIEIARDNWDITKEEAEDIIRRRILSILNIF